MGYSDTDYPDTTAEDDITSFPFHKLRHSPLPEMAPEKENKSSKKKGQKGRFHKPFRTGLLLAAIAIASVFFYTRYQGSPLDRANLIPAPKPAAQTLSPTFPSPSASAQPAVASALDPDLHSPEGNPTQLPAKTQTEIAQLYQGKSNPETSLPANGTPTATAAPIANNVAPTATQGPLAKVAATATPPPTAHVAPVANPVPAAAATANDSAISQKYEETSLNMQHLDVALFPRDTHLQPQTLRLNVPIVHEKRLLSFTPNDINEFSKIVARMQETRAKQIALQKQMREELADYNALIQKGTPEAVLNTDSPSLITNTNSQ
jgi:hypothetical protein